MRITRWAIPVGYMMVTVICWIVSARQIAFLDALRKTGVQAQAMVTGKTISSGKSTTYYLQYQFEGNGVPVVDRQSVSHSTYDDTHEGDTLLVTYMPADPEQHVAGSVDEGLVEDRKSMWQFVLLLITVAGAISYGVVLKTYRRQSNLLRLGTIVDAQVISNVRVSSGKSTSQLISFIYSPDGGVGRTGTANISCGPLTKVAQGDLIPYVFFDRDHPKGKLVQALTLVEVGPEDG